MKKIVTGALAALTLGGTVLGGASAASARGWDHHDNTGAVVAAGIAGLAIGAALSNGDHGYYNNGYYGGGYYTSAPGYYYGSAPAYYAGPTYYSYYRHCRVEWRWDRWEGRYERVRACF
jgi:hypothetical protein